MDFTLHVWRQYSSQDPGQMVTYPVQDISPDMSFLEMLDTVNEQLMATGNEPIAFDHDCREGICGSCSLVINGIAHGPQPGTTTCQTYMRSFADGAELYIEPWRATAFPVVKDLVVDRGAFDRIMEAGGFITINTGSAPDANAVPITKNDAESALDAAACIGCGACVAACPNGSAMLFTAAKVSHLASLPQGHPERQSRVLAMVDAMDQEGFGSCSNYAECEAVCPKGISVKTIAHMNREYMRANLGELVT